MSDRLSADELAKLTGHKPNQRCRMAAWLRKRHWKYEIDANGLPIVLRAYMERKLGLSDEKTSSKFSDGPNLSAFS